MHIRKGQHQQVVDKKAVAKSLLRNEHGGVVHFSGYSKCVCSFVHNVNIE
jgi:hypothetical protein